MRVVPAQTSRERTPGPFERVRDFVVASIDSAHESDEPFRHLVLGPVFPSDVYDAMQSAMPVASNYRAMSGRSKSNRRADGTPTRVKMDLFPEYIRHLPPEMRGIWDVVGRALCSDEVRQAFVRRLAHGLRRRFGDDFASIGMYPIPILTRDVPGYLIKPHTDTRWKGITVQIYLPSDDAHPGIGTIFHERKPEGGLAKKTQMRFVPNSGYAFAVGDDTWHSADPVGPEVTTRDSILLTYFVDSGVVLHLRNRIKRAGNFLANELRYASQPWRRQPPGDPTPRA
jgi:hypothetical protein